MECLWDEEKKIIRISDSKDALLWLPFNENKISLNVFELYQFIKMQYIETKKRVGKDLPILLAYPYQSFKASSYFKIFIYSDYYNEIFISELYIYLKEILDIKSIFFNNKEKTLPIRFYYDYIVRTFSLVENLSTQIHALSHYPLYRIDSERFKEFGKRFSLDKDELNIKNFILSTVDLFYFSDEYITNGQKKDNKKIEDLREDIYNYLLNPNNEKYETIREIRKRIKINSTSKAEKDETLENKIMPAFRNFYNLDLFIYSCILNYYWKNYDNDELLHNFQKTNSLTLSTALYQIIENVFHHTDNKVFYMLPQYLIFESDENLNKKIRYYARKEEIINLLLLNKNRAQEEDRKIVDKINMLFNKIKGGLLIYLQDLSIEGISKKSTKSIRAFIDYNTAIQDENQTVHYGLKFFISIVTKLDGFCTISSDKESVLRFRDSEHITKGDQNIYWDSKEGKHLIGTRYIIFIPLPLLA